MNFNRIKSFNIISCYPVVILLLAIGISLFAYALYGLGMLLHFDEWVGRGLYPGLALAYGADIYEPFNGPHITLYGAGTALFYAPAAIASTPQLAIWISFLLNLFGLIIPIGYLFSRIFFHNFSKFTELTICIITLLIISISILSIEPTTEGVLRTHADLPAFCFLLISLCFFEAYIRNQTKIQMIYVCFFLTLSVWAKAPTLPAVLFPVIYFVSCKEYRNILKYITYLVFVFLITSSVIFSVYGYEDTITILYKHLKANSWSVRNSLFYGKSTLVQMSYFDAIPLLFRFSVMYLAEYWYILVTISICTFCTWNQDSKEPKHLIIKNLCIIYFLTLPSCLAALAHYGSVHNALLFANAIGILGLIFSLVSLGITHVPKKEFLFIAVVIAPICTLPIVRISKSAPDSTLLSPHQQAFEYLKSGKDDIYFGWYPIAHLLHSGKAETSIEVPMHLSESMPENVVFSSNHFPKNARILATNPGGFGKNMLQPYLGILEEVDRPDELSGWRLFEPVNVDK
ncbi:MAG: hypothetical protein CMC93_00875 [Flavobacteriaceae bacterium]|nr:hypothetical protein [Flavobacteriaceae bacterium]